MRRRRIASWVGVLSLMAVWLAATPVSAEGLGPQSFAETIPIEHSDCGYPMHVDVHVEGTARFRVAQRAGESVVVVRGRVSYRQVLTNELTGESFLVRGQLPFRGAEAQLVEGSVHEVFAEGEDRPFVVEDSSGRVVARDRGAVFFRILFDTGGEAERGRVRVEILELDLFGPFPGPTGSLCRVAGDLVGISDSSERFSVHPEGTTASPLGYAEYLPPDYADDSRSPLLIFLHGAGDSGDGSAEQLELLTATAIPAYIAGDGWPDERPFVVLAPQHEITGDLSPYAVCDGAPFGGSCVMAVQHELGHPAPGSICFTPEEVRSFLTYAMSTYDVDPSRVYVTGLSCGAYGAWEYLSEHGGDGVVAAVVPIAGDGRPALATAGCPLGGAPLWAFHGTADDVVDPQGSIEPLTALQACSEPPARDARLTLYPDVGHDSWTATYALQADDDPAPDHDIYAWMLSYRTP